MVLLCSSLALMGASHMEAKFSSIALFTSLSIKNKTLKPRVYAAKILGGGCKGQAVFNPFEDQPIVKDALKEPVAFLGGVFAGLLRLDLNEDPLKEWIFKTVEASGIKPEEMLDGQGLNLEGINDAPQQIEIE